MSNDIQQSYIVWSFHGESFDTQHGDNIEVDDGDNDEMIDVLVDLARHRETSHNVTNKFNKIPINDHEQSNKFGDLFDEIENELYPGCKKFSELNFLVKLMHMKVIQ